MAQKVKILKTEIDCLTQKEVVEEIASLISAQEPHYIVTANAEIVYMAWQDEKMQTTVNNASIVTADGSGVLWAAEELGTPLKERVTGIDLVYAICEEAAKKDWTIYLLGAAEGVAAEAAKRLTEQYHCNIIGYRL